MSGPYRSAQQGLVGANLFEGEKESSRASSQRFCEAKASLIAPPQSLVQYFSCCERRSGQRASREKHQLIRQSPRHTQCSVRRCLVHTCRCAHVLLQESKAL